VAEERQSEFLPPQPAGPEPELGGRPPPQIPPASAPPGWQQPAAPGWQAPPGSPPPAGPWAYPPRPAEPDNGPAVAGFVLSLVAGGLLLFSVGLSSIVSVVCAAFGIVYSRRGRRKVDAGETPKHRGLAQAGYITGIVVVVLSVLATAFWLLILILALTDDRFQNDLERELNDSNTISATLRLCVAAARLGAGLLG
jgi:hypothetical protein